MEQHIAVYVRASSRTQDLRSQRPELERWVKAYAGDASVRWYEEKATGTVMERRAWRQLEVALRSGSVSRIVVWRLDRLGRTAAGLTQLFLELRALGLPLVSVREGFDLTTPAGHMMATILASVAQYETEVRRERQAAGIAAARAQGKRWGGREKGQRYKATAAKRRAILRMRGEKTPVAEISRVVGLSRPTVYSVLREAGA